MTIPRMEAIAKRWETVPPLSVSVATVAASMGVQVGGPAQSEKPKGEADLQSLVDAFGAAGLSSEKPAWLKDQDG